jgi:hypothetical protein
MKTSFKILTGTLLIASVIVLATACKKDSNSSSSSDNNNAANMSADGTTADNAYDDAFNIAVQTDYDKGINSVTQKGNGATTLGYNFCANVTTSSNGSTFPDTVTVDFGSGCTSLDNISRSGSIVYIFSGKLSSNGTTVSATFNNYTVNGYKLTGTYSITNNTTNILAPSFTTSVSNGSVVYPNATSYTFSGTKTVNVTSSNNSTNIDSLIFTASSGNYSIGNSFGESIAATITAPLVRKLSCGFISTGVLSFTYSKGNSSVKGTLDYGDGTCDNSALITIGAFTKNVTIP